MRSAIGHHGGTVEKFIGDAVMAIFGLPTLHEDDALRAVRAADDMRRALGGLNAELAPRLGRTLDVRIGINTGEVVAGDSSSGDTLATGDTVNTAARLEQAAAPGDILLGAVTARLVRGTATLQAVEPVAAKGKAEPIPAFRLVSIDPQEDRQTTDRPFLGRAAELERLRAAYTAVVRDGSPWIATVLGPPGVGKSRLVAEFLAGVAGNARILRGRCLSYGDGLTYWPLREIVLSAAGVDAAGGGEAPIGKLRDLAGSDVDARVIADLLAIAIGLREGSASADEIAWAARRVFERLASDRPLVLVVEDIHWARLPMLQLLEHVALEAGRAPILIVCPARPELPESAPEWGNTARATTLTLDGLDAEAGEELIDAVTGARDALPDALRRRILETAEGNPLFVEEMVRLVLETGDTSLAVPPTIEALLAARIDRLAAPERTVAQRGSVVGRVFERAAVAALAPEVSRQLIDARLRELVRKQLLQREGSRPPAGTFKFRHVLIRDAAYNALAKSERARLHEAFASWLADTVAAAPGPLDEIVGHHLEQAYRMRMELREPDDLLARIASEAGRRLAAAGRRTFDRGDGSAAARLYGRAMALPGWDETERADLLVRSALAFLGAGDAEAAMGQAQAALRHATLVGDRRLMARARLVAMDAGTTNGTLISPSDVVRDEVALALADANASGDARAIAEAWSAHSMYVYMLGDLVESLAALDRAHAFASRAGDERFALEMELGRLTMALVGPTPASAVVRMAEELLSRATEYPGVRSDALRLVAPAEGMLGRHEDARRHIAEGLKITDDLGRRWESVVVRLDVSWVDRLAGDLDGAERVLRGALADIEAFGDQTTLAFASSRLAVVLVALGRIDEALPFVAKGESVASITNRSRMIGARAR
ncbi:MAG TPA: AAA family ATPase, partial [Candidatus Acidoferrum sp.]|nr:AAA family ATPase [Candidatus Acidoferrum sp.]